MNQNALMLYCPESGLSRPYPSHAAQWRKFHGATAWLFNPWTGGSRDARDIGSDVFGYLIAAPSEEAKATNPKPLLYCAANRDGECHNLGCPQLSEPSGHSCPLPDREEP